ncbi:hypothetical protein [Paraglaciecola sp. L3A3]|uniref:hypothetical protein n=1 Tax=Paraglaciecola sp. L3A3 TaxID=2686358 RepID=UPI001E650338|nr:hypothetical protein [Paraglaciecola sp. L3A3]
MKAIKLFFQGLLVLGIFLTLVNLYGLTQNIRVDNFDNEYLRFPNDQPLPFEKSVTEVIKKANETDLEYAKRVTQVISQGVSHVSWLKFPADQFNQLIPIWENYFLYFMGKFSGIPEFERYHFANYERSLKRGIGICGDASMILSQLLDKQNIRNQILTFPGHVVVVAHFKNDDEYILDADFGVVIPYSVDEMVKNVDDTAKLYLDAGYKSWDFVFFQNAYRQEFASWNGVKHFITKKYYFEKIVYWLKWPLPFIMIVFSLWIIRKNATKESTI